MNEWFPFIVIGFIISIVVNIITIQNNLNIKQSLNDKLWLTLLKIRVYLEWLDNQKGIINKASSLDFNKLPIENHIFSNIKISILELLEKPLSEFNLYKLNNEIKNQLELYSLNAYKETQLMSSIINKSITEIFNKIKQESYDNELLRIKNLKLNDNNK